MRWMNLEPIIQSEVSQKEKDKYRILTHMYRIQKNGTEEFIYRAATSNAEEAEVEWFYEDLQDLVELTPKKNVLFIIGDWNAKVGSQETPGVTGKLGLEYRMKQEKG